MKKLLMPFLLMLVLVLSACGAGEKKETTSEKKKEDKPQTITYQSENGAVEVPANPERVVVLSSFAGNVMALDVNLVGVDAWSKMNPRFEKLQSVEEVTDENLEKIIELDPDLIVGLSTMKNVDKLKEIAPVVTFTYGKLDYLTQHLEVGKLLNKEKEAQEWIDNFKADSKAAGEEIKAKIGADRKSVV